ncbi:hypothetical protein R1sor_022475 [Riccia sorocarpa]|uniref:Uncharacterized protein n=1 Tax=Riccia sorocarpa TaxID=122646 RepID=A0ABD3GQU4_9MARC
MRGGGIERFWSDRSWWVRFGGVIERGEGGGDGSSIWLWRRWSGWVGVGVLRGGATDLALEEVRGDFASERYYFAEYTSDGRSRDRPGHPGWFSGTPRGRRGREDDPVGPDDLVTVANVHRVVSHEMLLRGLSGVVMVGNNRRSFRELARMSHIRIMTDCQSVPMVEAVAEGHPVYYREDHARRGTPTVERRTGFEFTLAFAKLCYARGVLRREVDFSRVVDAGG